MSMTTDERKAWARECLDAFLADHDAQTFWWAFSEVSDALAGLIGCECRTKHACCLDNDEEECAWRPCDDCEAYIKGAGTWQRPILDLLGAAENAADQVLPGWSA